MKTFSLILAALAVASATAQTMTNLAAVATTNDSAMADMSEMHEYGSGSEDHDIEEHGSMSHHDMDEHVGSDMEDSHEGSHAGAKAGNVTVPKVAPASSATTLSCAVAAAAAIATALAASL